VQPRVEVSLGEQRVVAAAVADHATVEDEELDDPAVQEFARQFGDPAELLSRARRTDWPLPRREPWSTDGRRLRRGMLCRRPVRPLRACMESDHVAPM